MLGTCDVEDVELPTADDVLATLTSPPVPSDPVSTPPHAPMGDRRLVPTAGTDAQLDEDVESDEILRELEEHHRRGTAERPASDTTRIRGAPARASPHIGKASTAKA